MIEVDQLKCFWSGDVAKLLNKLSYFHFLPTSLKLPIFENIFKLSALKRFATQPLVSLHCAYIYCIIFHCTLGALFLRDASNLSCIVPQSLWRCTRGRRLYSAPLALAISDTKEAIVPKLSFTERPRLHILIFFVSFSTTDVHFLFKTNLVSQRHHLFSANTWLHHFLITLGSV